MTRRLGRFHLLLALIVLAALAIRLAYALVVMKGVGPHGDGWEYHLLAQVLADHGRYIEPIPFFFDEGREIPTAEKPPGYPAFLALVSKLGGTSYEAHRAGSCLLGASAVGLIGLLARRVRGERAGLIAAGIAAVYPMLFVLDGSVRSESLYVPLIALMLLLAYRLLQGAGWGTAAALGAVIGLAALTRSEAIALIPLLALPVAWRAGSDRRSRLRLAGAACLACLVVIGPYQVRNLTTFDRPVLLATNQGGLLQGANCPPAYYGEAIGTWPCFPRHLPEWGTDESNISWHLTRQAWAYFRGNMDRGLAVAGVRVLRTWDLFDIPGQAKLEEVNSERNRTAHLVGLGMFFVLALLAVIGAVVLRRNRVPLLPLLAPVVLVTVVSAASWGSSRFRAAAEVAIVVLAAVAIDRLLTRVAERRAREERTPAAA
jgi:4-amino-4-deoxy-L-arabinose transferase-like glycosyltransferase